MARILPLGYRPTVGRRPRNRPCHPSPRWSLGDVSTAAGPRSGEALRPPRNARPKTSPPTGQRRSGSASPPRRPGPTLGPLGLARRPPRRLDEDDRPAGASQHLGSGGRLSHAPPGSAASARGYGAGPLAAVPVGPLFGGPSCPSAKYPAPTRGPARARGEGRGPLVRTLWVTRGLGPAVGVYSDVVSGTNCRRGSAGTPSFGGPLPTLLIFALLLCPGALGSAHEPYSQGQGVPAGPTGDTAAHHAPEELDGGRSPDGALYGERDDCGTLAAVVALSGATLLALLLGAPGRRGGHHRGSILPRALPRPAFPYPRGPSPPVLQAFRL